MATKKQRKPLDILEALQLLGGQEQEAPKQEKPKQPPITFDQDRVRYEGQPAPQQPPPQEPSNRPEAITPQADPLEQIGKILGAGPHALNELLGINQLGKDIQTSPAYRDIFGGGGPTFGEGQPNSLQDFAKQMRESKAVSPFRKEASAQPPQQEQPPVADGQPVGPQLPYGDTRHLPPEWQLPENLRFQGQGYGQSSLMDEAGQFKKPAEKQGSAEDSAEFDALVKQMEADRASEHEQMKAAEALKAAPEAGGSPQMPSLEDAELSALAKKSTSYNKPGLMEMLAVLGTSLDPRQSPQGSLNLAQTLRGEPERASAERSLARMVQGRSQRAQAKSQQETQLGTEAMRQQGLAGREGLLEQGRNQRAQLGSQTQLQVEQMRGQRPQAAAKGPSMGQQIHAANFHALGRINAEVGNVRQALRSARMSLDPKDHEQIPVMENRLRELDSLKREAVGMLHNAGVFGDEAAAMFQLGEGEAPEGMDPEAAEILQGYREKLNNLLGLE